MMVGIKDQLGDTLYGSRYPAEPGYKTGDTSKAAAKKMGRRANRLREDVYKKIVEKPSTADEVADALGLSLLSVRPRVSELHADKLIEKSGEHRKNDSGMTAIVWREAGSAADVAWVPRATDKV